MILNFRAFFHDRPKQSHALLLILCLLIGFVLRFYTFDQKSLWIDEIHTFNDARFGLKDQIRFYKSEPTYFQAPLLAILTHCFYPFPKPERDLRILPLLFGTLSIPMFYLLSRSFSPAIAIPCTLSLTFMTYHISLSQDGRSYALVMFFTMAGIFLFMSYKKTPKKRYLSGAALLYAVSFLTSYSSIPFILFSQVLWFYPADRDQAAKSFSSFFLFNGFILLFSAPWLLFLSFNYQGEWMPQLFELKILFSFWEILYGIFHDWVPHAPLMICSAIVLLLAPVVSPERRCLVTLLILFLAPIAALFTFCRVTHMHHFLSSRYFVCFLPPFLIGLFLSLRSLEVKWPLHRKWVSITPLFLLLFLATNLMVLPLYYRAEKQDFRRMVSFLKENLTEGDVIFDADRMLIGMLHYFRVTPEGRFYYLDRWKETPDEAAYQKSFIYRGNKYTIYHSNTCCDLYFREGNRLWIVAGSINAKRFMKSTPSVLKGYFDGSFLNF